MRRRVLPMITVTVVGLACTAPSDAPVPASSVPVLRLGEPTLEIGTLNGPEDYVFAAIESVVRLPNGNVAVSDAGASRISTFDASGQILHSWGQRGDGPGEFRSLSRLYPLGSDSLIAAERSSNRMTSFDLEGGLGRTFQATDLSGDSVFQLDSWLHGRFWVDGALSPSERRRVMGALDRLPPPREDPGYRKAFAGDDGSLWIREPHTTVGSHEWTRIDSTGQPIAVLSIPTHLRPTHFRADEVLGVWTGESDVHFARGYPIESTSDTETPPAWLSTSLLQTGEAGAEGPSGDGLSREALSREELLEEIRSAVRQIAGSQEVYYSTHMSYTAEVDSLTAFEPPETIVVDIARGDSRGWAGVFTHPASDRICALAYGFGTPAGWTPGMILCSTEPTGAN